MVCLTTIKFVDFLYVLGTELPQVNWCHFVRWIFLNKHSWTAVTVGKSRVLVMHDGCQIVLEALDICLIKSVLAKSVLETFKIEEKIIVNIQQQD